MASSIEFKDFILDQLSKLRNITCKQMMGEYLLYINGKLFGGIYDNKLLIKMTNSNKKYNLRTEIPYEKAKPMYLVDNVDDIDYLSEIVINTCIDL